MPKLNKAELGKISNGMRTNRGFLLLEVMASIIIITSGLLFVMRVYSTARMALERSHALLKNSLLLEDKMFDFEEKGVVEEGKDSGHFSGASGYSWQANAYPLSPDNPDLSDLNILELGVYNNKISTPDKYFIFTYLIKKRGL